MWNWIKSLFKDFEAAQQELAKENIFYITTCNSVIYYVLPDGKKNNEQNKKDNLV
jgi:hypothetical protein